jgi:hypothetical protein
VRVDSGAKEILPVFLPPVLKFVPTQEAAHEFQLKVVNSSVKIEVGFAVRVAVAGTAHAWLAGPEHMAPPFAGAGLVQVRV